VEFEWTISVFERAKTVHALDCAATVICELLSQILIREIKGSIALLLFQSIFFFMRAMPAIWIQVIIGNEEVCFLQSLQINARIIPQLGHDCFLAHLLQLIIH
jgi:hypothetical protein